MPSELAYSGMRHKSGSYIGMRQKSGSVGSLLNHEPPPPLRDHARDNVRVLREQSRRLREARLKASASEEQQPFKLRQFENVPSRWQRPRPQSAGCLQRPRSAPEPARLAFGSTQGSARCVRRPASPPAPRARQLQAHPGDPAAHTATVSAEAPALETPPRLVDRASGAPQRANPQASPWETPPRVPEHASGAEGLETENLGIADVVIDFDGFERVAARQQHSSRKDAGSRGLRGVQSAQHSDERKPLAELPAEQGLPIPAGYRLLPEAERLETLLALQQKLAELEVKYMRLPLKIETEGQRQQQRLLRAKIAETENAVKVFHRPRVLLEI